MWEKLQDSPMTASSVTPGLDDDDEVCAGIWRNSDDYMLKIIISSELLDSLPKIRWE
jgi:hypothetical protein